MTQLKYLGRMLEEKYSDWPTVHQNISKIQEVWWRLGKLLRWEGVYIQVSSLFHREMIDAVLLFGSESWDMSDTMMRAM